MDSQTCKNLIVEESIKVTVPLLLIGQYPSSEYSSSVSEQVRVTTHGVKIGSSTLCRWHQALRRVPRGGPVQGPRTSQADGFVLRHVLRFY